MHQDNADESGVYYLVPNQLGGKTIIRRPRPALTSTPLDEDFDAQTQGATTARGFEAEWVARVRNNASNANNANNFTQMRHNTTATTNAASRQQQKGTAAPHDQRHDGFTPTKPTRTPERAKHETSWRPVDRDRGQDRDGFRASGGAGSSQPSGNHQSSRSHGQQQQYPPYPHHAGANGGFDNYGEYGQYMNEMEKMFGGSVDLELSASRPGGAGEKPESQTIGRLKGSNSYRIPNGNGGSAHGHGRGGSKDVSRPSRLGSASAGNVIDSSGPKAGQKYEVIGHRVVEDGPERTVTIATWREQVAREAKPDEEMSVYYVGADDYALENSMAAITDVDNENELDKTRNTIPEPLPQRTSPSGSSPSGSRGVRNHVQGRPSFDGQRQVLPKRSLSGQTHQSRSDEYRPSTKADGNRSGSPRPRTRTPPHMIASDMDTYHAPRSPNRTGGYSDMYAIRESPPRTSTPVRGNRNPSPEEKTQTPPRASTPLTRELRSSPVPFHPTQSGSTISSIKSASFDDVLASCEPSLLHIGPMLAQLGISSESHLRAMARLSEDTRDRQLRDAALRQGVTVIEWAILLDKLRAL